MGQNNITFLEVYCMRKFLMISVAVFMMLAFVACGNGNNEDTAGIDTQGIQEANDVYTGEVDNSQDSDIYDPIVEYDNNEEEQSATPEPPSETADSPAVTTNAFEADSRDEFITAQGLFDNTLTGHLPVQRNRADIGFAIGSMNVHLRIICEDDILWGMGTTDAGNFGMGNGFMQFHEPIEILENIAFVEGQFAITNGGVLWHLGIGEASRRTLSAHDISVPWGLVGYPVRLMDNVVSVSSSSGHVLVLTSNGQVWGWGNNNRGQVVYPPSNDHVPLTLIMENAVYVHASNFAQHQVSFAITAAGETYVWGRLVSGAGGYHDIPVPVRIEGIGELASIEYGGTIISGIRTDGSVATVEWRHILSVDDETLTVDPMVWDWDDRSAIRSAVVGFAPSTRIVLTDNGYLRGMGGNTFSTVNLESTSSQNDWQTIRDDIAYFVALDRNIIAMDFEGQIWGWGSNASGKLGQGFESVIEGFTLINVGR